MKILVTGGAGFIGSHVVERLVREGHEVETIDNLSDFYPAQWKQLNLDEAGRAGKFRTHFIDISDREELEALVGRFQPEAVIHLAAEAGLRRSLAEPFRYERTNVHGTLCLLEACRSASSPRFIYASSSSVYGSRNDIPFRETDQELFPLSPYAATKLAGEKLCYVYSHLYQIRAVCLRLFTVYGPRQRPDLAIRKFIDRIENGETVTVFGDGSSARDYTYVADVVDGIVRSLDYDCSYDILNLGNSQPVSLEEMIRVVEGAVGRKARIEYQPWNASEAPITFAAIEKAQRVLGYSPRVPFEHGVQRLVDWLREAKLALAGAPPTLDGR